MRKRAEEAMAKHPGCACPVKVAMATGVSHGRVVRMRMTGNDYRWAGVCHVVAMGIQGNEQAMIASQLESQGILISRAPPWRIQ